MAKKHSMRISVIIPTLNAEGVIAGLIDSIKNQSVMCEIIVIDSSSSDNTVMIAESHGAKVVKINREDFDHGGTRNIGASHSTGEILVFMTQDAVPADSALIEELIKPLQSEQTPLSYARQIPKKDAIPPEIFARLYNYDEMPIIKGIDQIPLMGIKTFFCSNVCLAVRRKEFEEAGGFPERIIMNEDMVIAARLILNGFKAAYNPSAIVYHSHNYTVSEQFRRYFDIAVSLNRNKWILRYSAAEGEGLRFFMKQIAYLLKKRMFRWIPYVIIVSAAKFAGYRLGLAEDNIPLWLKIKMSLHRHFWRDCDKIRTA
ncbi:MAG: glycosyltransferase [Nitrospirae bacterium]|nr:glycosyltransferase [Nitrospirota bacterium]